MPAFFADYQEALDSSETASPPPVKPIDTGGDVLPFGHLEDRRFETLVYRLKYVELEKTGHRVTLMQGVGERGRDVVVHSSAGTLAQVVQCKNYSSRFTAPDLRKEMLKLALHHHLDSSVLGSGPVIYEVWCPLGLTEPAAKMLDEWPKGWTTAFLKEDALEVIGEYVAFKSVDWDVVGDRVVDDFRRLVQPRPIAGVALSVRVRGCLPVYEAFFQGKVVMDRGDVFDAVRACMAEASGFAQFNDKDAKHVLERISSFPQEQRHVHTSGYVMGLPAELVSRFNRKEYEAFATHVIQASVGMIQVVLGVCARLVHETAREFREGVLPTNKSITHVFGKTLNLSMIARVNRMAVRGLKLQPALEAYDALSLRERLEQHSQETWEEYQRCLKGYDPRKHVHGSDEEFRARIATVGIDGALSKEEFEHILREAVERHLTEIEARYNKFMALVPKEILLIGDTLTIFENEWLFSRMMETVNALERLRGSPVIPE